MVLHLLVGSVTAPGGAAMLTVFAVAMVLAGLTVTLARHARSATLAGARQESVHGAAALEQTRATAFLAQRDPDDRGRRRPRAPGRSYATA